MAMGSTLSPSSQCERVTNITIKISQTWPCHYQTKETKFRGHRLRLMSIPFPTGAIRYQGIVPRHTITGIFCYESSQEHVLYHVKHFYSTKHTNLTLQFVAKFWQWCMILRWQMGIPKIRNRSETKWGKNKQKERMVFFSLRSVLWYNRTFSKDSVMTCDNEFHATVPLSEQPLTIHRVERLKNAFKGDNR